MLALGFIPEIPALTARVVGASVAIVLSFLYAFAEPPEIVAVSGRDQLALHDLATGAELARFDSPGGSSDLLQRSRAVEPYCRECSRPHRP
jgi:hypothetical protein